MADGSSNSIAKALDVLLCFVPDNREMGTTELSERTGYHKATTSRIVRNLAARGFLKRDSRTGKYSLGPAVFDLGRAASDSLNVDTVQVSRHLLDDLRDTLDETVVLEVPAGPWTMMAYVAQGTQRVRVAASVGEMLPLHAAAGSKAILAFLPPEVVDNLVGQGVQRFTPNTIIDGSEFSAELEKVRRRGYSTDREEMEIGTAAVGAPVFNHNGEPVAAVVVAGPAGRIAAGSGSEIVKAVTAAASAISERLGYRGGQEKGGVE